MELFSSNIESVPDQEIELLSSSQPQPESETDSEPLSSSATSEFDPQNSQYSESSCWSEDSQVA